ncbi:DUF6223 family protein [Saccharopolyspora sp. NPDC050642]|uniref:DUF6223 family protein n=1 Tax=Saccharopolyspora sp. NPDC050642 TaxID=3157099 RepID=UPI003406BF22
MSVILLPATHVAAAIGGYDLGAGRTVPTTAAVIGLVSAVLGGLALARSAKRTSAGNRRAGAVAALLLGPISAIVGGLHGANSAGGLGTGNGLAGAIVAVLLGVLGTVLGGLALACSRRPGRGAAS